MACNWPLRGMKRTLFEGGVRGVGLISGAGLAKKGAGVVLDGFFHAADWMPSLLAVATASLPGLSWSEVAKVRRGKGNPSGEPSFELGDGINLWGYLSGAEAESSRKEIVHEAHKRGSTDGNGNALRVGDWKIVIRTGGQWSVGSHLGTNDGWYGGPASSDSETGPYGVSIGRADEEWMVKCPPPPQNVTDGYACEQAKGAGADQPVFTCLFNIRTQQHPSLLHSWQSSWSDRFAL